MISRSLPSPSYLLISDPLSHHLLSLSSPFLGVGEGAPEQKHPSQKTTSSIPPERIKASTRISETTHPAKSYVSSSFCSSTLKFCANMGILSGGEQLHCNIVKLGHDDHVSLLNHLLNLYVKSGSLDAARRLLDEMPRRNVVSWNIMISGSVGRASDTELAGGKILRNSPVWPCDLPSKNFGLFFLKRMMLEMVEPDYITFIGVLGTCIRQSSVISGKRVHCLIIKFGYSSHSVVGSAVVDLYAKCGSLQDARSMFDEISTRDLVVWNVMISCYSLNGLGKEAFKIFELMCLQGVVGDRYTFSSLLSSCCPLGWIELGQQIHGLIIRLSLDLDVVVGSALIDMYAKSGDMKGAHKTFDLMNVLNVVSWNSMIVGYGKNGEGKEAMKLLREMLRGAAKPDELTLASILSSCADLAAANDAVQAHSYVVKNGFEAFLSIGNALIGTYAKCGSIYNAFQSFSLISKPDLVTWTSMISAYAFHGLGKEAVEFFEKMLLEGVRPDGIAFVGVLSACSHAGLVDAGLHYFCSMIKDHQIKPDSEHYTCLVDLLGRAGNLDEAYKILTSMPSEPTANILGAFLGACKVHGNTRLAKLAADRLFCLEPDEPVNYMLMSNICAAEGCWDDVTRVRKTMRERRVSKVPGCSWIEIGGAVHTFISNDKSHYSHALAMNFMLEVLTRLIKVEGFVSDVSFSFDKWVD